MNLKVSKPYASLSGLAPHLLILLAGISVCACSSLPTAGPQTKDIENEYQADASTHPFELVDVTATTVDALRHRPNPSLVARFGDETTIPDLVVGRGDGLTVNIWEAGTEPLFSANPLSAQQIGGGNSARAAIIPEQVVGSDGCISIPFAGRIPVAGHTTMQAQDAIEQALAGKTQKPQILVNVTRNASNTVTVVGEVSGGARISLSNYGERLLDVLAGAGGIRAPTYETQIQLTRGDSSVTIPLLQVLHDPRENIRLHPGDSLIVTRQAESFTAFGAAGRNAQINFDATKISLTEAVAKAGGLSDERADPQGVFLFRFEPRSVAVNLGPVPANLADDAPVPVVYRLDLTKAGTYFLAQNFDVRDHDILYIANARATELEKFLALVSLISQPVIGGAVVQSTTK
jgi:polysaccharide biosynthesis/export protein